MRSLYDYLGLAAVGALLWWVVTRGAPKRQEPLVPVPGKKLVPDELPDWLRFGEAADFATHEEAINAARELYGRNGSTYQDLAGRWHARSFNPGPQ